MTDNTLQTTTPLISPNQAIQQAVNVLQNMNFSVKNVQVKGDTVMVSGTDENNNAVSFTQEVNGGYRAQTISTYEPTTIEDRRDVVQKLRQQNLTQQEIASRLGVSQKTISNDLNQNP